MPELVEQMYCSQQIVIPPKYPYILKRYCKAAIKTQPYDLLRWSYEYFKALALKKPPPVKLRLEYPIYTTEGGLTRGCLKVLAQQLFSMKEVPLTAVKAAWQGFCLDPMELKRILCLCDVYLKKEQVPMLHFIAVAGGLLTKCLTHTMILLCETLTKEPDGGSAAIPLKDFLEMYEMLAKIDASKDEKYINGYKEGQEPEAINEEEEVEVSTAQEKSSESMQDEFGDHQDTSEITKISVINDSIARSARISLRLNMPVTPEIERSPSVERAGQIERETFMRERKAPTSSCIEVDEKLKCLSSLMSQVLDQEEKPPKEEKPNEEKTPVSKNIIEIFVSDEDDNEIPYSFYGEPEDTKLAEDEITPEGEEVVVKVEVEEDMSETQMTENEECETEKVKLFVAQIYQERAERLEAFYKTLEELQAIVDRFKSANYDLGMVAGRQMSISSGEFIVANVEKDIMDYVNEQIAILPDPDLKKKKAKPEEIAMVRDLLEMLLDETMELFEYEVEEIEEEESPIPEFILVYAVPGIGPAVDEGIISTFEEYAREVSKVQADMFMPRNIRHFLCPPLEKLDENKYDEE